MIGLSSEAKDQLLLVLAAEAAAVGLFLGDEEVSDPRYERVPVLFSEPQGENGNRFIENLNELRFADMGRDHRVDHWGIFDTVGRLIALYPLKASRDVVAEDNAVFREGRITLEVN